MSSLETEQIDEWRAAAKKDSKLQLAQLLLTKADPFMSLATEDSRTRNQFVFNTELRGLNDKPGTFPTPVLDQKKTGLCWLYGPLNLLRYKMASALNVTELELSPMYLAFYDKLEKANFYLETVIQHTQEPLSAEVLRHLHSDPLTEGGQHTTVGELLLKYGCVPKSLFPTAWSGEKSKRLGERLNQMLRAFATELENSANEQVSVVQLRSRKSDMLGSIFNALAICLGTPPRANETLIYEYVDIAGKAQRIEATPKDFCARYAGAGRVENFVSLVNDPRHPYGEVLSIPGRTSVMGGRPVSYINAPIEVLERAIAASIQADLPALCGIEYTTGEHEQWGTWDESAFEIEAVFGAVPPMTKAEKLLKGQIINGHTVAVTAVHLEEGRPVRYKMMSAWGDSYGTKGVYLATAAWFRQNGIQAAVPRSCIPKGLLEVWDSGRSRQLPPWDALF